MLQPGEPNECKTQWLFPECNGSQRLSNLPCYGRVLSLLTSEKLAKQWRRKLTRSRVRWFSPLQIAYSSRKPCRSQ